MSKWSPTVFLTNSALTQLAENLCPGFLRVAKFFQPWQSAGPYLMGTIQIKSYLNPRRKSFDNSSTSSEKYFTQPLIEVTFWGPGTMNNPTFITESLNLIWDNSLFNPHALSPHIRSIDFWWLIVGEGVLFTDNAFPFYEYSCRNYQKIRVGNKMERQQQRSVLGWVENSAITWKFLTEAIFFRVFLFFFFIVKKAYTLICNKPQHSQLF